MAYNVPIDPLEARIQRIQQYGFRVRRTQAVADSVDDGAATLLTSMARVFPWMEPGVARSLSQWGYGPDHPVSQFAAQRSMVMQDQDRGVGQEVGSNRNAPGQYGPTLMEFGQAMFEGSGRPTKISKDELEKIAKEDPAEAEKILRQMEEEDNLYQSPIADKKPTPPKPPNLIDWGRMAFQGAGLNAKREDFERLVQDNPEAADALLAQREQYIYGARRDFSPAQKPLSYTEKKVQGVPGLGQVYKYGVKPTLRYAGLVGSYPLQELNSAIRNVYGVTTGEMKDPEDLIGIGEGTDLGVAIEQALPSKLGPFNITQYDKEGKVSEGDEGWFENVSTGSGFFVDPDSAVARIRRQRELQAGEIGGHAVTLGRILASNLGQEPDTFGFDLLSGLTDAGIAWYGDPLSMATQGAGAASLARKTFQVEGTVTAAQKAQGLTNGIRKYIDRPTGHNWVSTNAARIDELVPMTDPYEIDKSVGFTMGPVVAQRIASAHTHENVAKVIRGSIESGAIRRTDQLKNTLPFRIGTRLVPNWSEARMFQRMPGKWGNLTDPKQMADQLRLRMLSYHAKEDTVRAVYNNVAKAKDEAAMRAAAYDAMDRADGILEREFGIHDPALRKMATRLQSADMDSMIADLQRKIGENFPDSDMLLLDQKLFKGLGPHFTLRAMSKYVEFPDPRVGRRLTSRYRFLTAKDTAQYLGAISEHMKRMPGVTVGTTGKSGQLRLPFAFAEHLLNDFLKPAWLLRLAWPTRVIIEEQIRMANSPLDIESIFNHPISFFGIAFGRNKRYGTDVLGTPIDEVAEHNSAMFRGQGPWLRDPGASRAVHHQIFTKIDDPVGYAYNHGNHLVELHANPVSNKIANTSNLDEVTDWLMKGGGRTHLKSLRAQNPGMYRTRAEVRRYTETISDNIRALTGDNEALLRAVRTGKLGDTPLLLADDLTNPEFRHQLSQLEPYVETPSVISGVTFSTYQKTRDDVLDKIFGALMGAPTNRLSRSPTFRQSLWKEASDLLPGATRQAQKQIITNAKKAGIKGKELERMVANAAKGRGRLNINEINDLAKGYALDATKNLLYDLTERRQWADIMRIAIPFGDAYQEILSRWSKLIWQNKGRPLRRAQQLITAAREPGAGNVFGAPEGQGWFHDNEHGEEVFEYPFSRNITSLLTGLGVPLVGRVEGLNMIGTGLPGVGPAVQLPVAWIVDRYPSTEGIKDIVAPFGGPGFGEQGITDILDYGPAWLRSGFQWLTRGGANKRLYANTIMNVAASLQSSGKYGKSRKEQTRLMDDAAKIAHGLTGIRALGMFMLPSSPALSELIKDKSGNMLSLGIVTRAFYEKADEVGPEEATTWFLDSFGEQAIGAIIPKTVTTYSAIPKTKNQAKWWRDHPQEAKEFESVYGFFGPQGGDFDYDTYVQSILSGQREMISPKEWRHLMDDRLGDYYYSQTIAQLGEDVDSPNDEQRAWKQQVADEIKADYPFWNRREGLPERPSSEDLVADLYEAMKNKTLAKTKVGKATAIYLYYRDQAEAAAVNYNETNGTNYASFREAKVFAPTRTWLRGIAADLIKDYPDFRYLFENVLDREMSSDVAIRQEFQ